MLRRGTQHYLKNTTSVRGLTTCTGSVSRFYSNEKVVEKSSQSSISIIQSRFFSSKSESDHQTTSNKDAKDDDDNQVRVLMKDLGDGIFNLQLNRPKKYNALDMKMFHSLASTLSELQTDYASKNIRCIIVSGNGKAFCTGLDVPSMMKPGDGMVLPTSKLTHILERPSGFDKRDPATHDNVNISNLAQDLGFLWRTVPVPVISVLHGMCFGGGLQIALGADIRIATENCKLSLLEAKWGIVPDMSATITLRELISIDVAKELTFTGRVISGVEAKEYGLVTKVVRADKENDEKTAVEELAMKEALSLAKEIVKKSPDAVAAGKLLLQKTWIDANEEQCLELETKIQKQILPSWNQFIASTKNFGMNLSYVKQKDIGVKKD